MARVVFEFLCSGGCGGYILIPLDDEIDADVIVVCPKCKHTHARRMRGGKITEGRHQTFHDNEIVHMIEPTMAAYSEKSRLREETVLGSLWARVGGGVQ